MDIQDLQHQIAKFVSERDWDQFHNPKNLAIAVSTEAAELLELFQWLSWEESVNLSAGQRLHLEEEIGDVLICLVNLAAKVGIDPVKAAHNKMAKNRLKYPIDKCKGHARKYDEL